jgi:hypothetical protein
VNITRDQLLHLVAGAHNPARLELSHGKQVADEAGKRVAVYLDWWAQRCCPDFLPHDDDDGEPWGSFSQ